MKNFYGISLGVLAFSVLLSGCRMDADVTTPPPALSPGADSGVKLSGERAAARELQAALKLTEEQKQKLKDLRRQSERERAAIMDKYNTAMAPYKADVMSSSREKKPLDPKIKKEVDEIAKRQKAELDPLEAALKAKEQAVYTPEQKKLLEDFAKKH